MSIQLAIRQYNISNDRMTYRADDTIYDFKNAKAREAYAKETEYREAGHQIGYVPLSELLAICAEPGDGFGSQHTGPRNG